VPPLVVDTAHVSASTGALIGGESHALAVHPVWHWVEVPRVAAKRPATGEVVEFAPLGNGSHKRLVNHLVSATTATRPITPTADSDAAVLVPPPAGRRTRPDPAGAVLDTTVQDPVHGGTGGLYFSIPRRHYKSRFQNFCSFSTKYWSTLWNSGSMNSRTHATMADSFSKPSFLRSSSSDRS
jgi:hypothetical protein